MSQFNPKRFSLKGLLLAVLLLALPMPWLAFERSRRLQDQQAMTALQQSGFSTRYYNGIDPTDSTWLDRQLDALFGRRCRGVYCQSIVVSDLSRLQEVDCLRDFQVLDSQLPGLKQLENIDSLRLIELTGTPVNDIQPLHQLKQLQYINLNRTGVTEAQVHDLVAALPDCRILHESLKNHTDQ